MRLSVFLVFFLATFAVSCNALESADKANTARHLKGAQTDDRTAEDEERSPEDIKAMEKIIEGINAASLGAREKISTTAVAAAATAAKQQKALETMKSLKNIEAKTTTVTKDWKRLTSTIDVGAPLKKLDTSNPQWKDALVKAKQTSKLGVTEAQAAKLTEAAAKQVVNNPSKWRYVRMFLEVSVGIAFTALILVGINSMIST